VAPLLSQFGPSDTDTVDSFISFICIRWSDQWSISSKTTTAEERKRQKHAYTQTPKKVQKSLKTQWWHSIYNKQHHHVSNFAIFFMLHETQAQKYYSFYSSWCRETADVLATDKRTSHSV